MTIRPMLSNIKKVELRSAWPNEALDFTPWLAMNIQALGEALGMELETQEMEAAVGTYSLDILATDLSRNLPVIIENQLETTDHDHLGKLLTYAAGFDANVVVWLTREFKDEHRQALDWLNQRTGDNTEFFGVVVELWKIDNSNPAPHFNLVATPNDWRKQVSQTTKQGSGGPTATNTLYQQFFQQLIDTLRNDHQFTGARKGQPQNWYSFATGFGSRMTYGANFAANQQARVELYIDTGHGEENLRMFDQLEERRNEIEFEIEQSLSWERLDNRRACRIATYREGSITDDQDTLEGIRNWMVENLLRFKKAFDPHIRRVLGRG